MDKSSENQCVSSDVAHYTAAPADTLQRLDRTGVDRASCVAGNQSARNYIIHKDSSNNGYKSIDLFAGAGGTALGLSNAGFEHLMLSEIDKHAVSTLTVNRPNWNVVSGNVSAISFTQFRGQADLLEGGFPCQAFSYAGHSKGFADTRGTLFFEFVRAIAESMPKVFVGENVKGLLTHDRGNTLETMLKTLKSIKDPDSGIGYTVAYRLVRAQYHDVPQKRERLILIGVREDISQEIYFPRERDYFVSLWDAISDCPSSEGQKYPESKKKVLDRVPAGGNWRDLPENIQREYLGGSFNLSGGKTGIARRLSWDEPSLTLTCSPAQKRTERCHPDITRPLSVREYARIQTFPDDWEFSGGMTSAYRQIGNAVPVNLGYFLGKSVQAILDGGPSQEIEEFVVKAKPVDYA